MRHSPTNSEMPPARLTIANLANGAYDHERHQQLGDKGARRYHPYSFDFDSTPHDLQDPNEHWDEAAIIAHNVRRTKYIDRLKTEYGTRNIEQIIENVRDLGVRGMSLISYHNQMHQQARDAFIVGAYYPALVSACALGERILNHLILDLRDYFKNSPHYRKLYRKKSFDDWAFSVAVLEDWNVFKEEIGVKFRALATLRNRSIHFNLDTYDSLREDALLALRQIGDIISMQFGYFGRQPWFIEDTPGAQFIKAAYENVPFVRTYLVPRSGFVGVLYGMELRPEGFWQHLDYADYGEMVLTDEEFAKAYRERIPDKIVTREMIEASLHQSPDRSPTPS